MDIAFPLRGWDTTHPRYAQPDGTSADLLNVIPFDRDYRGRGAVRPGLSKFSPTQLGNGAPVLGCQQTTVALDPSSVVPGTLILNETWASYVTGQLNTVASTNWLVTDSGGTSQTGFQVTAPSDLAQTDANRYARYQQALTLGGAYIVELDINFPSLAAVPANYTAGILVQITPTGTTSDSGGIHHFTVGLANSPNWHVYVDQGGIIATGPNMNSTFLGGVAHTISVHVNGTVLQVFVDGVLQIGATTILASTQSGVGFTVGGQMYTGAIWSAFRVYIAAPLASFRQSNLVAVCGGSIYVGSGGRGGTLNLATNGSNVLSSTIKPQMAFSKGYAFIVDSQHNLKVLTLATQTVADIVPTTGLETATTLGSYTLACIWRDRLVLAATGASPQNFIMSRQGILPGTAVDFDYSQTDAAAAVAGNASKAGAIGDPLNCLIPWTDDVLILGGDHSIYKVEGDIAAGGQILLVSDSVGTLGPDCWDSDPSGNLYLVGSGGLYRLSAGMLPQNISNDTVKNIFVNINRVNTYVVLTWDRDRNGLFIHLTPVNSGPATHLFYDATTGGFFPVKYPDSMGPLTSATYDGDGPLDRQLLLAGRDGYIRAVDTAALTDDGTAITSYVQIGPFRPAGDAALSVLEAMEVLLGDAPSGFSESDFQMTIAISTGKDVYTVLNSPERTLTFSFTKQARRKRLLQRLSGGTFLFKISGVASKLWSLEKLIALFTEGGLQRRY